MSRRRVAVGVDAWKGRWVAVTLVDGQFLSAALVASVADLAKMSDAIIIGIDIPIGLPDIGGMRQADVEARRFIGARRSSVFMTPSLAEFEEESHAAAVVLAREVHHPAMSIQAWGLRQAIAEIALVAAVDARIYEVHPEVSFAQMARAPLLWPKTSWNGARVRLQLLREQGIDLPDEIPEVGLAAVADVLDAAAAAWSADRIARGVARSLPNPPEVLAGRTVAIWV